MASADVVGSRVSPGLADGETALRGLSHELQLDPFAALFEVAESLPIVLAALTAVPCAHPGAHSLCPPQPLCSGGPTLQRCSGQAASAATPTGLAHFGQ